MRQFMRHKEAVDWRLNCRRRDEVRLIASNVGVQNLQRDLPPCACTRHRSPRGEALVAGVVQHRAAGHHDPRRGFQAQYRR